MARWIVAGLMVLNLVLGAGVYLRMEQKAQAQIGRKASTYATVAGQSANTSIIYVLDVSTGNLAALKSDVLNGKVTLVARRNVAEDIKHLK